MDVYHFNENVKKLAEIRLADALAKPIFVLPSHPYKRDCASANSDSGYAAWSSAAPSPDRSYSPFNHYGWCHATLQSHNGMGVPLGFSTSGLKQSEGDEMSAYEREEYMRLLEMCRPRDTTPTYDGYICHICYEPGHFISRCPKALSVNKLTPYQGPKTVYGEFLCPNCKRVWSSAVSRSNLGQRCVKCSISTMPRKQMALEKALCLGRLRRAEDGSLKPVRKRNDSECSTLQTSINSSFDSNCTMPHY